MTPRNGYLLYDYYPLCAKINRFERNIFQDVHGTRDQRNVDDEAVRLMDNEQETIDRVKQISPDRCRQASTRPMEIMHRSCRVVILRSSATDETMVPLFIS